MRCDDHGPKFKPAVSTSRPLLGADDGDPYRLHSAQERIVLRPFRLTRELFEDIERAEAQWWWSPGTCETEYGVSVAQPYATA